MSDFTAPEPAIEESSVPQLRALSELTIGAGDTMFRAAKDSISIGNPNGGNYILWDGNTLTINATINSNFVNTVFPQFIQGTTDRVSIDVTSNTEANVGMAYVSRGITVDTITIRSGGSVPTPGTVDIAIYSENGQTKILEFTTPTISSTFTYYTTSVTPTDIPVGNYYIAIVPNGTTSVSFMGWKSALDDDTFAVTGGKVLVGVMTVSAGTLPSTFNPVSDITFVQHRCPILRLDNL